MPSYTQYKRQMAVLDDDNDIESWITVHGNHIPIKKGQSKEDAVKSFIESKGGNTAKGYNQKSELGIIYHKDKGHIKEGRPPKDWTKVEGGTTAPNGYSWYSNNKSMFGGERESYLYKDEPEDTKMSEVLSTYKDFNNASNWEEIEEKLVKNGAKPEDVDKLYGDLQVNAIKSGVSNQEMSNFFERKPKANDPKTEFQEAFKGTKWNAGNGFATYVDEDYRFEIYKEGGMYVSTVSPSDDYDGSDVEEEEMFSTLQEARNHAEQMVKEYAGLSDEQKADKVKDVRKIVGGSVQYEKTGKVFRLTGYYSGGSVDLDFEKLTGHSPESSVRYEMHGSKLYISDYNGRWEKEIDFDKLSDEEIADMIKR